MTKKQLDITAIVAIVALLGSGFSWIISVERRMTGCLKTESYYAQQKLFKEALSGEIKTVKNELDTDIRGLRERLNTMNLIQ